jgi:hypothetical protein
VAQAETRVEIIYGNNFAQVSQYMLGEFTPIVEKKKSF